MKTMLQLRHWRDQLLLQEDLNFLLTNRVPRQAITQLMGRFSKIRNPWICRLSIAIWRLFTDLDLSEAKKKSFDSLHDCFTRELVDGARSLDDNPRVLSSPCDGIVGASGSVRSGEIYQSKGFPYRIEDLFGDPAQAAAFMNGTYVTLSSLS